jgi:hypothetical protein
MRVRFHLAHDRLGFCEAAPRNQPARRLGQPQEQPRDDQSRNAADEEHHLPAEHRHQNRTDLSCHQQTDREEHLVEQEEPPASSRFRQFVDIDSRHRHLAAHAHALHEPADEQHPEAGSHRAAKAHHRHDRDGGGRSANASDCVRERPEDQCAEELPHVTD